MSNTKYPFLVTCGEWVLGGTLQNEKLQIVFVMLILPLTLNIVQFWVIDQFIEKKTVEKFPVRIDDDDMEDQYGLVDGFEERIFDHDDDDDDDDAVNMVGGSPARRRPSLEHLEHSPTELISPTSSALDDDEFDTRRHH